MKLLNESVQWALLLFIAVFVLGLTRQLGLFLVPRRAQLSEAGPPTGREMPNYLLGGLERSALREAIQQSPRGQGLFVVTHQECEVCEELMVQLADSGRGTDLQGVPVAILASGLDQRFVSAAEAAADVLVKDGDGSKRRRSRIVATPFVFVLDSDLRILHKEVTADLEEAIAATGMHVEGARHVRNGSEAVGSEKGAS
jgi:hypothetical protein